MERAGVEGRGREGRGKDEGWGKEGVRRRRRKLYWELLGVLVG